MSYRAFQEGNRAFKVVGCIESRAAVGRPVDDIKIHIQLQFFVDSFKLVGLIDRHLRVAIAV